MTNSPLITVKKYKVKTTFLKFYQPKLLGVGLINKPAKSRTFGAPIRL
jgi:hypothetical protein